MQMIKVLYTVRISFGKWERYCTLSDIVLTND